MAKKENLFKRTPKELANWKKEQEQEAEARILHQLDAVTKQLDAVTKQQKALTKNMEALLKEAKKKTPVKKCRLVGKSTKPKKPDTPATIETFYK
jgi:hypothetical protein